MDWAVQLNYCVIRHMITCTQEIAAGTTAPNMIDCISKQMRSSCIYKRWLCINIKWIAIHLKRQTKTSVDLFGHIAHCSFDWCAEKMQQKQNSNRHKKQHDGLRWAIIFGKDDNKNETVKKKNKQRTIVIGAESTKEPHVNCASLFLNSDWDSMGNFSENIPQATFS